MIPRGRPGGPPRVRSRRRARTPGAGPERTRRRSQGRPPARLRPPVRRGLGHRTRSGHDCRPPQGTASRRGRTSDRRGILRHRLPSPPGGREHRARRPPDGAEPVGRGDRPGGRRHLQDPGRNPRPRRGDRGRQHRDRQTRHRGRGDHHGRRGREGTHRRRRRPPRQGRDRDRPAQHPVRHHLPARTARPETGRDPLAVPSCGRASAVAWHPSSLSPPRPTRL